MLNFGIDCIANKRQRRRCIFNAKQKKWRENSTSSDYEKTFYHLLVRFTPNNARAQAFWRKILHIFTTDVGELFAQFRQSFWRNH